MTRGTSHARLLGVGNRRRKGQSHEKELNRTGSHRGRAWAARPPAPQTSATCGQLGWFPEGNCDTPSGGRWPQTSREPGRKSRQA